MQIFFAFFLFLPLFFMQFWLLRHFWANENEIYVSKKAPP